MLFYVDAEERSSDSYELIVQADNPREAIAFWHGFYALASDEPARVFAIQPSKHKGALGWHTPSMGGLVKELTE